MPLAEKGVRGKGRQPLSPLSTEEAGARSASNCITKISRHYAVIGCCPQLFQFW